MKHTNLIFAEHNYLKLHSLNLEIKNSILEETNSSLQEVVRLSQRQIDHYQQINDLHKDIINQKNRDIAKLKKQRTGWVIGGVVVSGSLLTLLLVK